MFPSRVLRSLDDFDALELFAHVLPSIDFQQVLQLHTLVHIQDALVIALVESLLFVLLSHLIYLLISLRQYLVG